MACCRLQGHTDQDDSSLKALGGAAGCRLERHDVAADEAGEAGRAGAAAMFNRFWLIPEVPEMPEGGNGRERAGMAGGAGMGRKRGAVSGFHI